MPELRVLCSVTQQAATASYRLLPHITIRSPIPREHQEKFKDCFPPGVIAIEPDRKGDPQCVVKNPRKDTVSREVLRHPEFQDLVQLSRIRDHFLCELFALDTCVVRRSLTPISQRRVGRPVQARGACARGHRYLAGQNHRCGEGS